jgi:hypothetical protein
VIYLLLSEASWWVIAPSPYGRKARVSAVETWIGWWWWYTYLKGCICLARDHHDQPVKVPTAGAQAFLMDYTQGERAIIHHAGPVWIGSLLTTAHAAGTYGLTCLPKHRGTRDNKFLVTHPMTDQRCLTSANARRNALTDWLMQSLTAGPSSSSSSEGKGWVCYEPIES